MKDGSRQMETLIRSGERTMCRDAPHRALTLRGKPVAMQRSRLPVEEHRDLMRPRFGGETWMEVAGSFKES